MAFAVCVEVVDASDAPVFAQLHARDHAALADLCAVLQRIGNMRNQRARLGSHLAALQAETTIDTMWPVTVRAGKDRDRAPDGDRNIQRGAALDQGITNPAHRVRTISIAVRMAPGIIRRPRNWHL